MLSLILFDFKLVAKTLEIDHVIRLMMFINVSCVNCVRPYGWIWNSMPLHYSYYFC